MARAPELDWDDLRYFLRAAQAKTLAGAARRLGVEHTTIGRRLTALERALGAALVARRPDGLHLTALGEEVMGLAEQMESRARAVSELVASHKARVRLSVPSGFTKLFAEKLAQFTRERPELSLELMSGARPVDLHRGEADLALRSGPIADKELVARKLCDSGFALYASADYLKRHSAPLEPAALRGHELIGYDASLAGVPAAKWIETRARSAAIALRSRELTDMLAAAVSGVGIAALPCMLGDVESSLQRLTPDLIATTPLSLVYRREGRLSKSLRSVANFVVQVIEANRRLIAGA